MWLIFFVLGVILPWRGRVRTKKLLAMPQVSTTERLALYASTIAFQWFAVAVVAWRAWAHGFTASQLSLTIPDRSRILVPSIVGAATIAALQWLNLRRVGKLPVEARGSLQALAERILPQSTVELLPYLALAITAGLCEEFLYRGFAMAAMLHVGLQAWAVVLLSNPIIRTLDWGLNLGNPAPTASTAARNVVGLARGRVAYLISNAPAPEADYSLLGLVLAPISIWLLVGAIALLTATAWLTVLQRILFVRKQLRERI